jgi:hypothetical protein
MRGTARLDAISGEKVSLGENFLQTAHIARLLRQRTCGVAGKLRNSRPHAIARRGILAAS